MKIIRILFASLAISALSSCGTWVDLPGVNIIMGKCSEAGIQKMKEDALYEQMLRVPCSNAGKAFTGDVRCEGNTYQVKCN